MLAQRFSRLRETPIRYALDPAHAQAIYNFLKLQSRVYGIPEMMGSQENRQLLGNAHPLGMELAQQLHHGDDQAAMVLPDLLEEHGALPIVGGKQGGNLLFQLLHGLRNRLGDPGQVHGYGDQGHREYGQRHSPILQSVSGNLRTLANVLPDSHPQLHMLGVLRRALLGSRDPAALVTAHDVTGRIGNEQGLHSGVISTARMHNRMLGQDLAHMNDFMSNYGG